MYSFVEYIPHPTIDWKVIAQRKEIPPNLIQVGGWVHISYSPNSLSVYGFYQVQAVNGDSVTIIWYGKERIIPFNQILMYHPADQVKVLTFENIFS